MDSHYIRETDEEKCLGCSVYYRNCLTEAVVIKDKRDIDEVVLGCVDYAELVLDIADDFLEVERTEMIAHG